MKLEIPVKVDFDDVQAMIDELKKIQTYKLFEEDDTVFVILDDVISILTKHIRATHNSSESPNNWIPCSERLPKQQQTVLIQDFGQITIGYLNAENRWRDLTNLDDYLKGVVAWMPLPDPWKEEE